MKRKLLFLATLVASALGFNANAQTEQEQANYNKALQEITDGHYYQVYTTVEEKNYYLKSDGKLTASKEEAYDFQFKAVKVANTAYETGWNLGCRFTNPTMSGNGGTGDPVNGGGIRSDQNRDNYERQVFFLNDEGEYAVRATNATGDAWGANTYWTVFTNTELPTAGYGITGVQHYIWKLEDVTATEDDYKEFNDALEKILDGKTIGFEKGQYAPYTNVEAMKALAPAMNINPYVANLKKAVIAAKEYINGLSTTEWNWVKNPEEVNAVYNGDFALSNAAELTTQSGHARTEVTGWTDAEGFRLIVSPETTNPKDNSKMPGVESASAKKAVFVWNGTYKYGETVGYTMPLAAHTIYELTFKHAGWEGANNNFYVSITDANGNVLPQQTCGQSKFGPQTANCWNTYKIIFATNENVGNVVLNMIPSGNSSFTDITLFKAESQELVFGDNMPSYAPGTYPTVKIEREFSADKWATAVYPFAIPATAATVATLTDFDEDGVLNFSTESASVANEPCLIKAENPIVLNNVKVEAKAAKAVESNGITFNGVYSKTELVAGDDDDFINYVLSDNTLYPVGSKAATVNAYRAYFKLADDAEVTEGAKSRLIISVDGENGEATGIDAVEIAADKAVGGEIYNLAGQRVAQPTNGIYIVNGKKVLIKK